MITPEHAGLLYEAIGRPDTGLKLPENIFYCEESDSVFISTEKTYTSPVTGKETELIGWVESNDVNKSKEIDKILDLHKQSRLSLPDTQKIAKQANAEGGNEMSDNTENVVAEDAVAPEAAVEDTTVVAPAEEAPAVEEAPADAVANLRGAHWEHRHSPVLTRHCCRQSYCPAR